jgi:hypothetical protein
MASKVKLGNVILCEYLVVGAGNKHTLINVFSGDVIVESLPAVLRLAMYIEYQTATDEAFNIIIDVKLDGKTLTKLRAEIETGHRHQTGILAIPGIEVGFDRNVTFGVRMTVDGEQPKTILKKQIYLGSVATGVPSASPPPSSRSRNDAPASKTKP